jgi:hypothetical protein
LCNGAFVQITEAQRDDTAARFKSVAAKPWRVRVALLGLLRHSSIERGHECRTGYGNDEQQRAEHADQAHASRSRRLRKPSCGGRMTREQQTGDAECADKTEHEVGVRSCIHAR